MKSRIRIWIQTLVFFGFMWPVLAHAPDPVNRLVDEMIREIRDVKEHYTLQKNEIYKQLTNINDSLTKPITLDEKVNLLIRKDRLRDVLLELSMSETTNIQKIRYIKGLEIIKILYDRVLSLDHHFSSLVTFNEINKISNPNNYPEFERVKDMIKQKVDRKHKLQLTSLLGQNIYTSTIDLFMNLLNSGLSSKEKEAKLQEVQCILDFTLRMNNDLKTIYFETTFLQKTNQKMIGDIEKLFRDYTKPIGYYVSLKDCRNNDDWETVRSKLDAYIEKMEKLSESPENITAYNRMVINLNFPIDRLLQFINQYNNFIDQGVQYYRKFIIILNSYEHERQCSNALPASYSKLKSDIQLSIEKFNMAYRPVEINGTKLKEIIYGINEYQ